MAFLTELWMPIVLSAVFVFIVSSILHMVIPIHKNDYAKLEREDAILDALRSNSVEPGTYMFPNCASMKDMGSEEMQAKFKRGPVGWMTILAPGGFNMGRSLSLWFGYCLLASVYVAYITREARAPGAAYLDVFQVAGATAFLGYGFGAITGSIWKGEKWSTTGKFLFDGLLYALTTGGTFGWLWPSIEGAMDGTALPGIPG